MPTISDVIAYARELVWDVGLLDWVPMTQPGAAVPGSGVTDTELRASPVGM